MSHLIIPLKHSQMKTKEPPRKSIHHNVIHTKHVFCVNDQVFLKQTASDEAPPTLEAEEWFPIHFRWIPILKVGRTISKSD